MPSKPKRFCKAAGCSILTTGTYCDEHKSSRTGTINRDKAKQYDKQRGKTMTRKLYDRRWREYSKEFLKRNPKCIRCGAASQCVDHILPHKGNAGLFWTKFNHQALCNSCHSRKTASEDGGFGNKARN